MSSHCSCRFAGLLALFLAMPRFGLAQNCTISPDAPTFLTGDTEDRLHALQPLPENEAPHRARHGQGLYGENAFYLDHLAVFMGVPGGHPHNFQVVLEVEFEDPDAKAGYQRDRAQHPDLIYTVFPPFFDQAALVADYPGRQSLRRIPESPVSRGHFEQGGTEILGDITFDIIQVVYFREFLLGGPKLSDQHYLLFGKEEDVFLSHLISAPPDFQQILLAEFEVEDAPEGVGELIKELLARGLYLHLPDRENVVATRLRNADALTCSLDTGTSALPITVKLDIVDEPYCEAGEFVELVFGEFNAFQHCDD